MDQRGLYEKFTIIRNDGKSEVGEKHHGCRYFVVDLDHDECAMYTLAHYAKRCRHTRPALADDIEGLIAQLAADGFI